MTMRSMTFRNSRTLPGQIAHQCLDGVIGDLFPAAAVGGGDSFRKWRASERNVFLAFAQRRHEKGNHVQAVEQIFAEISLRDLFFQVFVRRGDHAGIDGDRFFESDGSESALVERAQHLRLRLQTHVADFVEEERAAVGLLKLAVLIGGGSREGSATVSEEFALDHVFGNGGAIHFDEHRVFAQALRVDGACDELFPVPLSP